MDKQNTMPQSDFRKSNLYVRVISPDLIMFEGEAKAVSLTNDKGPFDILPGHENFISIIKNKVVIYDLNQQKKEMPIISAVIKVYQNQIDIFTGVETLSETSEPPLQKLLDI